MLNAAGCASGCKLEETPFHPERHKEALRIPRSAQRFFIPVHVFIEGADEAYVGL